MNKKIVGGCGCLVLVVIGVVAAGMFSARQFWEKGKGWINAQVEDAKHRSAIESAWSPPTAKPDARWFPAVVDQWTLSISEDVTTIPDLQLDRPGRRGKYRGEKQDIEVTIVPANELERDGIFTRADAAFQESNQRVFSGNSGNVSYKVENNSSHVTTRTPGRLYVRVNGENHLRLWWVKDWLFIFRTTGPEDPDAFADKFLESMTPRDLEKP